MTVKPRTLKVQTQMPVWYLQENSNRDMMGKKGSDRFDALNMSQETFQNIFLNIILLSQNNFFNITGSTEVHDGGVLS